MKTSHFSSTNLQLNTFLIAQVVDVKVTNDTFLYKLVFHKSYPQKTGFITNITKAKYKNQINLVENPNLNAGDIIEINGNKEIILHLSPKSKDNVLIVNNDCNLSCINCPQTSRVFIKSLHEKNLQIIDFLDKRFTHIALSGGEPTLDIECLCRLLKKITSKNKQIDLDILTNAVVLANYDNFKKLQSYLPQKTRFIISLYSDVSCIHDELTTQKGSFYKTVKAIHTIASFHWPIELRFIINKINFKRLPHFVEFVYDHFPYIYQLSLVGMEYSGFANHNSQKLFIKQSDYASLLVAAVEKARQRNLLLLIYNHQLCHLNPKLWNYCVPTISEWKTLYLEDCDLCLLKGYCGGFFSTSDSSLLESSINPITVEFLEGNGYEKSNK